MRSLFERSAYKVTTIEEDRDVSTMKLDELMGSLQTFELNLKMNRKEKSITFQAEQHESSNEGNLNDDESLVLLTKKFNRFLKRLNKKKTLSKFRKNQ